MRAKRYFQRTGKKIFINANDTAGYDKSKVECFNYHKMGHFARECRAPRNKEGQFKNQDNTRKQGNNKDTSSKAMLAIDGVGFEWSDLAAKNSVVPPPHPLIYNRPKKLDLSYAGLDEFKEPEFKRYGSEVSKKESNVVCDKKSDDSKENSDNSLVKEEVSKYTSSFVESSLNVDKETVFPVDKKVESVKPKNHVKPVKKSIRVNYNYTTKRTHPNAQRNMVPRAVLMKTGLKTFNSARTVNTAHPKSTVFSAKPIPLNTAKAQAVNTARPQAVNTTRLNTIVVNVVRVNQENAVKASACWVWRPTKPDSASITLKKHNYIDARGISKSILRNLIKVKLHLGEEHMVVEFLMCDKKNHVLFTDTECLVLSPNFKLPDESQILLKIPRKDNMYSFDMKNIIPKEILTCLVAKATLDESMLWHMRLGYINFKNINKLVKDNLVKGLPTKHFENDQTCVACLKGKQHRTSCKSKVLNPITKPLFMLHMDLFGPTFVSSLMHKKYCLVVTNDYSRFTWVFFLSSKDETSKILKNFIKEIENLMDKKVKIIRSDNGTEFKNKVMDDFWREKGIKREYSVARTPQQNGVAERRNRTLIEAARTILGKFDGKSDEGFFVGYSLSSKAFRVYNTRTRRVEENLHFGFLENKPMIEGNGPKWLFDIDSLTQSMNYIPVIAGTISNDSACTLEEINQDCIMMPIWKDTSYFDSPTKDVENGEPKTTDDAQKKVKDSPNNENVEQDKFKDDSSTKDVNAAGQHVNTASPDVNVAGQHVNTASPDVNTGSLKLNTVGPSVNTASSNE
ncbi:putative ribonuclease H-like domain-containing protein [Tanacetum coccineum]